MVENPNIIYDETYYKNIGDVNPAGYSNYCETTYYDESFEQYTLTLIKKLLNKKIILNQQKVLVTGCAFGFSVKHLIDQGIDAYGIDRSLYAISQADDSIKDRLIVGDVRNQDDWDQISQVAGLNNLKFDIVIDEDVIVCLNDADSLKYVLLCRKYGTNVVHIVSCFSGPNLYYNTKSLVSWQHFCDIQKQDYWYKKLTWEEPK